MIYLIILFGLVLRLISLNQSLWLDEGTTALVSKMGFNDIFTKFLPGDFHPPLYYLLIKYWAIFFGSSEISLRIPSIIFGLGSVYLTFLIAKKLFGHKEALYASTLLATSGLAIYYSQEARMYSMVMFFVTLAIYTFLTERWKAFSITLFFTALTDYVVLFMLPVFWYLGYKNKKFITANIPFVLGLIIWSPVFYKQLLVGLSIKSSSPAWWQLIGTTSFKNIMLIPIKFILGRITFDDKILYGFLIFTVLILFFYLLFSAKNAAKLIWFWLLTPVAIGILVSFKIPTLSYFRFLFCLPAFYILVAKGIGKSKIFFVLVLIINLASGFYYLLNVRFWREDWRGAGSAIGRDVIVYPANSQKETLIYYGKGKQIIDIGSFNGGPRTIWLSRYLINVFDPNDLARKKIESLGYNNPTEYDFNGVPFLKYGYK